MRNKNIQQHSQENKNSCVQKGLKPCGYQKLAHTSKNVFYPMPKAKSKILSFITKGLVFTTEFQNLFLQENYLTRFSLIPGTPRKTLNCGECYLPSKYSIMKSPKLVGHLCSCECLESSPTYFICKYLWTFVHKPFL